MDKGVAVLLMAVVGGLIALQAPINASLGRRRGASRRPSISFAVGTVLLAAIVILSGKAGGLGEATSVPWYYLIGGLLGAAYVFTALVLVDEIGAGGVAAATVTGQLTLSVSSTASAFSASSETPRLERCRRRCCCGTFRWLLLGKSSPASSASASVSFRVRVLRDPRKLIGRGGRARSRRFWSSDRDHTIW